MDLRRSVDVASFYTRAESFLLRREAEHNLILGICASLTHGLGSQGNEEPPYLVIVEKDGVVLATAVRTPPRNVVVSHTTALDALDLVARDLHESGQALPGVTGPKTVSRVFADCWHALTGRPYDRAMALRIYQLEAVNPVEGVSGHLRRATEDDRTLIVDWREALGREALGEADRVEIERSIQRYLSADPSVQGLHIWDDGGPVSMAAYSSPTPNGIRIVAVYTPPEHRRKGYATACVAALSQQLLDAGRKFCFLFTDLANPTSNRIYQAIGYVPVSDVDEYRFGVAPATEA